MYVYSSLDFIQNFQVTATLDDLFIYLISTALILLSTKSEYNTEQVENRGMKNKELYLKNLEDYLAYGTAIYGGGLYLFDNEERLSRFYRLSSKLKCCSCCCCLPWSSVRSGRDAFIGKLSVSNSHIEVHPY